MELNKSPYIFGADSVDVDKVTEEQLATIKLAFETLEKVKTTRFFLDPNQSPVTTKGLDALFHSVGLSVPESEMGPIRSAVDMGNGTVDFAKLLDILGNKSQNFPTNIKAKQITVQSPNEREILDAFKVFDSAGSGSIDAKELKHYFMTLGDFKEEEVDEMLSTADSDGVGKIKYYQLVKSVLLQ